MFNNYFVTEEEIKLKHTLYTFPILLVTLIILNISIIAEEPKQPASDGSSSEIEKNIDPEAMDILINMAQNLSTKEKFKVKIKNGYDAVQSNGQKVEFGSIRNFKYKRPNLCRIDITERDGTKKGIVFDGTEIVAFDNEEKVYAKAPKPGTCDDAIDYFKNELQIEVPLSELFDTKLPEFLKEIITEGYVVEESQFGDTPVTHLAFRTEKVDFQIWVDTKENLPKRIIISYKNDFEHPQFWAYFKEWDLSPRLRDSNFKFDPPKDFEKIPFSPVKIMGGGEKADEKK